MAIRLISARSALNLHDGQRLAHRGSRSDAVKRTGIRRARTRLLIAGCLGFAAIGLSGCTLGSRALRGVCDSECIDDCILDYRNRAMAEKAWHCRKHQLCDTRYAKEYKDGFIQGYMDIASGGAGCTPTVAPSNYWGWQYQSAGGHQAINAWFQGFPQGVKAAEEDGVGHWQSLRVYQHPNQPAPLPMGAATIETITDQDQPELTNPFYSDEPEVVPVPEPEFIEPESIEPEFIEPGQLDPLQIPNDLESGAADESESVFDGLFPPVAIEAIDGAKAPDAVIADGGGERDPQDTSDGELPFTFE